MSGLGAETTEPEAEAEPVSPAPVVVTPVEEEPAEEEEEEGKPTWFEPNTDARLQRPASLADKTFPPERDETPEQDSASKPGSTPEISTSKSDDTPEISTSKSDDTPEQIGADERHTSDDEAPDRADAGLELADEEGAESLAAALPTGNDEQNRATDKVGDSAERLADPVREERNADTGNASAAEDSDATGNASTGGASTASGASTAGTGTAGSKGTGTAGSATASATGGAGAAASGVDDGAEGEDEAVAADAGERLAAAVIGAAAGAVTTDSARNVGQSAVDPRSRLVDPEQVLSAYPFRFKPGTLREVADHPDQLRAVRDRLTDKLEYAERDAIRARLLSLRAVVSRVLGDLDFALADGRAALEHAERTGELRRTAMVQARLGNVLRWRGDYAEADRLFEDANSPELPGRLRAEIAELAGRSAFEQDRYLEAMNRFEEALDLRRGDDPERAELALDLVTAKIREHGWGPYSRTSDEIMGRPAPAPLETGGTWALAQEYAEGLAWARRPDSWAWELVDADGRTVIDTHAGYLQVRPFSEGLAWVSREPVGGWFAIDARNRLVVSGGFEDVMPFRNGVAAVKAGGWGAVDRYARPVVQPRYRRFVTVLTGGRQVDGFTREGLAIVDAGDRLGVVDRRGQLIVAPVHPALVIHPVAFLIADRNGRWGALDREGEPLIEPVHRTEADVVDAIEDLLADTRPVM